MSPDYREITENEEKAKAGAHVLNSYTYTLAKEGFTSYNKEK